MRSLPAFALLLAFGMPAAAAAQGSRATASLIVNAQFSSRTSLKISTQVLHFALADPAQAASVAVDFSAAARTGRGAEVMLSVEPIRAPEGPGGAADIDSSVSFAGDGQGTLAGSLDSNGPSIAGRWIGSGLRTGRLLFFLRSTRVGCYVLPVRFVLSAP